MAQDGVKGGDKAPDKGESGIIAVTVYYQQRTEVHSFRPSAKVEDVLDWAITKFGIDAGMAGEFEMARHGVSEELPGKDNLGRLATGSKTLELDLVRGDIANGAFR